MLLLYAVIISQIQTIPGYLRNMYHSSNHLDGYCLSYYTRHEYIFSDNVFIGRTRTEQLMSYCLRPAAINSHFQHNTTLNITFAQLRRMNITSEMLISWDPPVELAERYQIFLNTYSILSPENDVVFYICTPPWFGPFCRFAFHYSEPIGLLADMVDHVFLSKPIVDEHLQMTCYMHLACGTSRSCLDWREICDGRQDCSDSADEKHCWELEMNECDDDEYRCSNGQCIPWDYYHDDSEHPDCLDRTDELRFPGVVCHKNPGFKCEEHTCQPRKEEFSCGDGECIDAMSKCQNGRRSFLPINFCTNVSLCAFGSYDEVDEEWCERFCSESDCVRDNCSMGYEFRKIPLLFGHVRFFVSNETIDSDQTSLPDYICYEARLCPHLPPPTVSFDSMNCHRFNDLGLRYEYYAETQGFVDVVKDLFRGCLTIDNEKYDCSSSSMYQCINSTKCISKHRLLDGMGDCPFGDDETYNESCSLPDIRQRFKCANERRERCFSSLTQENHKQECKHGEDEYEFVEAFSRTHISFQTICDGVTQLLAMSIDGQDETDETGCEPWECNNTYSRCNGIWSCKNGADEVNCPFSTCATNTHSCMFLNDTSKVSCLPIDRAGDDVDDCIGGADEKTKNRIPPIDVYSEFIEYTFRCQNDTKFIWHANLCNNETDCPLNDDEKLCTNLTTVLADVCFDVRNDQTDIEKYLCKLWYSDLQDSRVFFKLHNVLTYPSQIVTENASSIPSTPTKSLAAVVKNLNYNLPSDSDWACHRGIPLHSSMPGNTSTLSCLCSPGYYGPRCQYQNQRVSLTLQVRPTSDWRTIFVFLITLIDSDANIESHEHIEYTPSRDCPIKYNVYLLYATRPKNISKIYSVKIDAFIGMTLKYRASWIFPLRFAFLPVHRLPVLLTVPFSSTVLAQQKCSPSCIHGQCSSYVNAQNSTFCHCESGWLGARCDMKAKCECASDAVCASDSICLCPPGRFGARCHLFHSTYYSQSCLNGGQRAPIDARYVTLSTIYSLCICPEGYIGGRCQHRQERTQIDIRFHHKLTIPPSLLVHFIAARDHERLDPNRTSIAKKLQFDQSSLTLYTTTSFNIALAQISNQYYLIILREEIITTAHISTQVVPEHRCRPLAELFNDTFCNQHLLKRIKSYHLPCQQHRDLACFYDDVHMCLCTLDGSANCLEFDHNMTYECEKAKYCGKAGECFQDDPECPTSSFCVCHRCYFGSRCQFSTKGSALSLDIILGYHIRSNNSINQQPSIVKAALALTLIILAFGLINGVLSFQTFRGKETRSVGCGLYLLTTSVVSMITVVVLTLKFAFLVSSQIGWITSRWFLDIQCASMNFLLRSSLSVNDWLSVCVAIERAVSAIQGARFSKRKSKRVAKWVIAMVVVLTSCSYIYDPVRRRVTDDEDEQRTWCLTQYSSSVQAFDRTMNIVHFSFPSIINAISAVTIVITMARTRSTSQKAKSYREHLREQLHHHKHLLISPLVLVILSLPRLVISFLSGCMGSARDSLLYLIGYYISFIPTILTLLVFILPSELYRKELRGALNRMRCR